MVASGARAGTGGTGKITRFDAALDQLLNTASPIEVIADGLRWAEGPVWVREGSYLLFSDVPANVVHRWRKGEGARPFLAPSGLAGPVPAGIREAGANGLAIDADGALIMADSGTRAIAHVDLTTKRKTILADRFEGKRFNSCNDVAIARDGAIYFTDPPYGLADGDASPLKELAFNGVYRVVPGDAPQLIDRSLRRPNGVALSPAGDRLYVACSDEAAPEIRVYDLGKGRAGDGTRTAVRRLRPRACPRAAGAARWAEGCRIRPSVRERAGRYLCHHAGGAEAGADRDRQGDRQLRFRRGWAHVVPRVERQGGAGAAEDVRLVREEQIKPIPR